MPRKTCLVCPVASQREIVPIYGEFDRIGRAAAHRREKSHLVAFLDSCRKFRKLLIPGYYDARRQFTNARVPVRVAIEDVAETRPGREFRLVRRPPH